jgi:dihydroneopterin aldolase
VTTSKIHPVSFEAEAAPAGAPPGDRVLIRGLRAQTHIGLHDQEQARVQPVVIDLIAERRHLAACRSDAVSDTIDYASVRARVLEHLRGHGRRLLEALAEDLADILLSEFGADWVRVQIVKPHKFEDVEAVGVCIERRRPPAGGAEILRFLGRGLTPQG